jgi:adenine deaminase
MTIAHDSHNLVVIGDNDEDMKLAAGQIVRINGGIVVVRHHQIAGFLPLEIGGLMTTAPVEDVIKKLDELDEITRSMGVKPEHSDPFLSLAFLSLPVIPEIKLTDKGLFDVRKFGFIPLEAEAEVK